MHDDRGSAPVEFTLVSVLLVILVMGVVQLALALHVRNTMTSCAAEGARVAAAGDRSLADGEARSRGMLRDALGDYPVRITSSNGVVDGAPIAIVTASAPVPVLGLWGFGSMAVAVRAYEEVDRG